MQQHEAVKSLAAMAHDGRLTLMRMLIMAGEDGIGAGELSHSAGVGATTASAQLATLGHAGLVKSLRTGREVTYYAEFSQLRKLMGFLLHDCCQGRDEICAAVLKQA